MLVRNLGNGRPFEMFAVALLLVATATCGAGAWKWNRQRHRWNRVFLQAILNEDTRTMAKAVRAGADARITVPGGDFGTPLLISSRQGDLPLVGLLLAHGAQVNQRGSLGSIDGMGWADCTPLMVAARSKPELVHLLLAHGADPILGDRVGETALMHAADRDQVESCRELLDHGAVVNAQDRMGRTALALTAIRGNVRTAKLLLQRGADANVTCENGYLPLDWAVSGGNDAVAALLRPTSRRGPQTATVELLRACARGDVDAAATALAAGADVNARSPMGATPLLLAVRYSDTRMVGLLLQHGADRAAKGREPLNPVLLLRYGDQYPAKWEGGVTPAGLARKLGRRDLAALLSAYSVAIWGASARRRDTDP